MKEINRAPATKADISILRGQLKGHGQRLDKIEATLQEHGQRLDKIEATLQEHGQRLDKIEARLDKIEASVHQVVGELVNVQQDLRQVKETMATKADINRILDAIDAFAGKAKEYDQANVFHGHALLDVQSTLKDHEKRIAGLESSRR